MRDALYVDLAAGDLALIKLAEHHRDALRAACAQDTDIWPIYGLNYGPPDFDANFDGLIGHESRMPYAVVHGGNLVGMTAFLRPDWSVQTVEIGNSYIALRCVAPASIGGKRRCCSIMPLRLASAASNFASTSATGAAKRRCASWAR